MEMKRSFAYLVLALLLSLLLSACGDTTGRGNVTASPWPEVTTPIMPTPTADFSLTPVPDAGMGNDMTDNDTGMNNDTVTFGNTMPGNSTNSMTASTPVPTDTGR